MERFFGEDEIIVSKKDPRGIITYANDVFQLCPGASSAISGRLLQAEERKHLNSESGINTAMAMLVAHLQSVGTDHDQFVIPESDQGRRCYCRRAPRHDVP